MASMLFATFDTETTGLPFHKDAELDQQPRIIEFAGIITDGVEIIDQLEFIVNPGIVIEQVITDITGLKNEDLIDKPDIIEYIPKLKAFFSQADATIAHNLSFDKSMAHYDLLRRRLRLSDISWPAIEICTVEQTFHQYGRRMRLIDLVEKHIGPYTQKHRAMDDVMLLHELCKVLGVHDAFKGGRA
jgi:DNA polymerase III alpha subunit (gram-positive type)